MKILERLREIKARVKIDYYINIFDNTCEYSTENVGFFISDLEEFSELPILQNELKHKPKWVHTTGNERINIAFNNN